MLYFNMLKQEKDRKSELWVRQGKNLWPVFDYKVENDQIRLIFDQNSLSADIVTLGELVSYIQTEEHPRLIPYLIVDEQTGKYLDIKDRLSNRIIFEICN